jgi:hypothetical protein
MNIKCVYFLFTLMVLTKSILSSTTKSIIISNDNNKRQYEILLNKLISQKSIQKRFFIIRRPFKIIYRTRNSNDNYNQFFTRPCLINVISCYYHA